MCLDRRDDPDNLLGAGLRAHVHVHACTDCGSPYWLSLWLSVFLACCHTNLMMIVTTLVLAQLPAPTLMLLAQPLGCCSDNVLSIGVLCPCGGQPFCGAR
jgi:hypothetical protein